MGKPKRRSPVRVTIDLSPALYERLERLKENSGAPTKAAVMRYALQLYEFIVEEELAGSNFYAKTKDGDEKQIFLLKTST